MCYYGQRLQIWMSEHEYSVTLTLSLNVSEVRAMKMLRHLIWGLVKAWKLCCKMLPIYWNKPNRYTSRAIFHRSRFGDRTQ